MKQAAALCRPIRARAPLWPLLARRTLCREKSLKRLLACRPGSQKTDRRRIVVQVNSCHSIGIGHGNRLDGLYVILREMTSSTARA